MKSCNQCLFSFRLRQRGGRNSGSRAVGVWGVLDAKNDSAEWTPVAMCLILWLAILIVVWSPSMGYCQSLPGGAAPTVKPTEKEENSTAASDDFNRLITQLVLDNIPHTFTEDKDWGQQAARFDGLRRTRDGFRPKFEKRKKMVNHGTWKKYTVSLRNPQQEFAVAVARLRELDDDRIGFDISFQADLDIHARQSKWIKGVQVYSVSADGHGKVSLQLDVRLQVKTEATSFPPDLVFVPKIETAKILVDEFRIDRVSKAGGEFSQQVSRQLRPLLDAKVKEKQQGLVDRLNKKLAQNQDRLRLPVGEALESKWSALSAALFSKEVRAAVGPTRPTTPKNN